MASICLGLNVLTGANTHAQLLTLTSVQQSRVLYYDPTLYIQTKKDCGL